MKIFLLLLILIIAVIFISDFLLEKKEFKDEKDLEITKTKKTPNQESDPMALKKIINSVNKNSKKNNDDKTHKEDSLPDPFLEKET